MVADPEAHPGLALPTLAPEGDVTKSANKDRVAKIPDRHLNLIICIARGLTYAEAGEELNMNPRTLKAWAHRMMLILDVDSFAKLPYAYYVRTGDNPLSMHIRR